MKKLSDQGKQVYQAFIQHHKEKMRRCIIKYIKENTSLSPTALYKNLIEHEMFVQWLSSFHFAVTDREAKLFSERDIAI